MPLLQSPPPQAPWDASTTHDVLVPLSALQSQLSLLRKRIRRDSLRSFSPLAASTLAVFLSQVKRHKHLGAPLSRHHPVYASDLLSISRSITCGDLQDWGLEPEAYMEFFHVRAEYILAYYDPTVFNSSAEFATLLVGEMLEDTPMPRLWGPVFWLAYGKTVEEAAAEDQAFYGWLNGEVDEEESADVYVDDGEESSEDEDEDVV